MGADFISFYLVNFEDLLYDLLNYKCGKVTLYSKCLCHQLANSWMSVFIILLLQNTAVDFKYNNQDVIKVIDISWTGPGPGCSLSL